MSLVRDFPFPMVAMEDHRLGTCSAIYLETTAAYTTGALGMTGSKTTVSAIITTGDLGGLTTDAKNKIVSSGGMAVATTQAKIIDRLRFPIGAHYGAAAVMAHLVSTRGTTEANAKVAIGVKLQHGDSSAGGDMADYSTGSQPDDRISFGSSVRTTDMLQWDASE